MLWAVQKSDQVMIPFGNFWLFWNSGELDEYMVEVLIQASPGMG